MTLPELRAWLDRKPPPGSWRDFEGCEDQRDWEEFELLKTDVRLDDTRMASAPACTEAT